MEQKAHLSNSQAIFPCLNRREQIVNSLRAGFFSLYNLGIRKTPIILNHKVTIRCDCRCLFCDSWKIKEDPKKLLTLDEIKHIFEQAKKLGLFLYSAWGGEPLLRSDLPEILYLAKNSHFFTVLSTDGSLLAERAKELVNLVDLFLISLDGTEEKHDQIRQYPGLFNRVVEGINQLRALGRTKIRLFSSVNTQNLDQIFALAEFAREMKVSIYFYPTLRFPGYNDQLILSQKQTEECFQKIIELKKQGYPIVNHYYYLETIRDGKETPCYFPKMHIYLDWEGTLYTCDLGPEHKGKVWGNIREINLSQLFSSPEFKRQTDQMVNCNACRLSCWELGSGKWYQVLSRRLREKLIYEYWGQ